jgi:excisionase family DNA binding protein
MKHDNEEGSERLLLGKRETARVLGVSVRMVDYLIAQGKLTARRIGRRVLLHYEDLREFAERDS